MIYTYMHIQEHAYMLLYEDDVSTLGKNRVCRARELTCEQACERAYRDYSTRERSL